MHKTRLERLLKIKAKYLLYHLQNSTSFFNLKIFALLLGFFTANVLSTFVGQTGDWDVLIASTLAVVVEYIGFVIYKNQKTSKNIVFTIYKQNKLTNLFLLNIWKIGFTYGLFVDCFKVGS
uniref:hypothetical chloroplast RF20 n=1 Tax=Nitella hyalina TaxID=181804 RepID=UPI00286ACE8E|nr:hypothetical chloroplast RF20 [Nitella hyalina]YP_010933255.1 hypothetical chloroplast RF20 [Nitella hyalina]WKT08468.1 hypothetical chloroplast RF20 [Nitella hyalina]WKT08469.1 hypothetical chloroplast RF20 [Nitella hyalina]